ncbi:MAG TPA: phenylalanine--tRNA ligase subunit beta, partial [Vicinamibacterales bacterium]|nr:phenylalanine--tRNA ligase subunit beta [Vicinamibacterales bacterium]
TRAVKILVSWLRDFVDVTASPEEIAKTMSVRGFAVEGLEHIDWNSSESRIAKADAVIDFEVTGNRPDCMCVMGMAREIATAFNLPMRRPVARGKSGDEEDGSSLRLASLKAVDKSDVDVVIENPDLCPRYAGAVADVTIGPSPGWMQARLQAAGVRPISNIVDVTNYVLLEMGQPMHAFDFTKLAGAQIVVRTARAGESIRTLDGQMRELAGDMLVIADAERPVAIAGVMGGAESEVADGTTVIVLESAYFNPLSVRRTSRKLTLKTEASMRFERGLDPRLPVTAMERACALLETTGAGRARGTIVDRYPARVEPRSVRLRRAKIAGLLGAEVPDADVKRILESLGFTLRDGTDGGWDVNVPTRRVDVTREVDVIEEVARHYGFDKLPSTFPPLAAAPPPIDPRIGRARHLRHVMTAAGFSEAMTFGFVASAAAAPFAPEGELVPIANPLSENFAVLRPSALPSLVDAVAHNRRREQRDVRLFEVGARFSRTTGERRSLACAWTGAAGAEHWSGGAREVDFFDMKGIVERIGDSLRLELTTATHGETWLVAGRSAAVMAGGTRVGVVGQLAPAIAEAHGLPSNDPVYVAEIDLDTADAVAPAEEARVEALPRYPSVTRDISILIDATLPADSVRATIRDAAPPTLVQVREFDRYQGKGVPEGQVSLSMRLTFRASDRTLTDAEIQTAMDAILAALRDRHAAQQR